MRPTWGFTFLYVAVALTGCSQSLVAPMERVTPPTPGPPRDTSGAAYGEYDRILCSFTITNGPVELPARTCVNGGGKILAAGAAIRAGVPTTPAATAAPSSGTIEVPLRRQGGVLHVPVGINNAITLDFVVDSGATDVSIPADVVMTLTRTGTLTAGDFLGSATYRLADGSTVPSQTFRIRSLKVGNTTLENVTGSVASVKGSLLLGQSFLGRFRSWSIDNGRQMLVLNDTR
jgi:predicted aspartyl protease